MRYVMGVSKAYYSSKKQKSKTRNRKYFFSYEFNMESGKFRRIRISLFKAIYYKITFVFGLKYKMVGQLRKDRPGGILYCKDCKENYFSLVNFWDKDLSCPYC